MDSPPLVVIPPTPIRDSSPRSLHPSPTPTSRSSIPELSPSTPERDRSSSETTIVTIYSMYGEDEDEDDTRRSWAASQRGSVVSHRHRPSKDVDVVAVARIPEYRRNSYLAGSNGRVLGEHDEDSAFYDSTYNVQRPSSKHLSVVDRADPRRSVASEESVQLAYGTDSRPPSSYVRTSTATSASAGQGRRSNVFSHDSSSLQNGHPTSSFDADGRRKSYTLSLDPARSPPPMSRTSSRPTSQYQPSSASTSEYATPTGTPNGRSSFVNGSPASVSKPLPTSPIDRSSLSSPPLQSRSPSISSPTPGRPSSSALRISVTPSGTPLSSPPERQLSAKSSNSGKSGLLPAEGEEPDAFHVRSTYAQLDQQGVKGDGYEEGVERTRARVGGSRASELRAMEALADEHEKTRDLTPQELKTLASVDRYGFFATVNHDRLVLLPSSPLLKPLTRVITTVPGASANAKSLPKLPPSQPLIREASRIAKWSRMLQAGSRDQGSNVDEWSIVSRKEHKLQERIFKGIPDCWRGAAWEVLMNRYSKSGRQQLTALGARYREGLDMPSTYDIQIDLDVPRTITGHIMFRTRYGLGQRSLFHVLHCLSLYCEECGYCQGMGPIAATLLCYFSPEKVYASLVRLHDAYSMHTIFSPGFPGLLEAIYVQEQLTQELMPAVYAAFKKHMISTTSYATKWYITLFANSVPFQTQLRLWDAFLLEGPDIFVMVAVAVVWVYRDHITSDSANFESVLSLLSSFFVPEDENTLLSWIEKVASDRKLRSKMQQWRQDWNRLASSGQHMQALL